MHFARKTLQGVKTFGRKAYHAVHRLGNKVVQNGPIIMRHLHEGAALAERYGKAIGHERLANINQGPLISHEAQRNILDRGFGLVDRYA